MINLNLPVAYFLIFFGSFYVPSLVVAQQQQAVFDKIADDDMQEIAEDIVEDINDSSDEMYNELIELGGEYLDDYEDAIGELQMLSDEITTEFGQYKISMEDDVIDFVATHEPSRVGLSESERMSEARAKLNQKLLPYKAQVTAKLLQLARIIRSVRVRGVYPQAGLDALVKAEHALSDAAKLFIEDPQ